MSKEYSLGLRTPTTQTMSPKMIRIIVEILFRWFPSIVILLRTNFEIWCPSLGGTLTFKEIGPTFWL